MAVGLRLLPPVLPRLLTCRVCKGQPGHDVSLLAGQTASGCTSPQCIFACVCSSSSLQKYSTAPAYIRKWVPALAKLPDKYVIEPWTAPDALLRVSTDQCQRELLPASCTAMLRLRSVRCCCHGRAVLGPGAPQGAGVELGKTYPHRIVIHETVSKTNVDRHAKAYELAKGPASGLPVAAVGASGIGATQVGSDPLAAAAFAASAAAGASAGSGSSSSSGGVAGAAVGGAGTSSSSSSGGGAAGSAASSGAKRPREAASGAAAAGAGAAPAPPAKRAATGKQLTLAEAARGGARSRASEGGTAAAGSDVIEIDDE